LDHFFGAGFRPARFLYFQFRWTEAGRVWLAWK
jgi:hypothetical protein